MNKIDREQIYELREYTYKNFAVLDDEEKRMVWSWRNDENIRQWMTNQESIPYENHLRFIENLNHHEDRYYWLVFKNEEPIAVFDIVDVDYVKEEAEPGYYLNPELLNSGEGLFFNYNFRDIMFNVWGFGYVKGKIKVGNSRAYTMSSFFQVKPIGIENFNEGEHLVMRGRRDDFNQLTVSHLLKDFVRYNKEHKVDWEKIKNTLKE